MKSKLGISYIAISIIAFAVAYLGSLEGLLIILGGVLIVEKDKWLSMQVLQALYLYLVVTVLSLLSSTLFNTFSSGERYVENMESINTARNVISYILQYGQLLFVIWAVLRLKDGKDAELPGIWNWAKGTVETIEKVTQNHTNNSPYYPDPRHNGQNQNEYRTERLQVEPPKAQPWEKADDRQTASMNDQEKVQVGYVQEAREGSGAQSDQQPIVNAEPAKSEFWFCPSCGQKNKYQFCSKCGKERRH